MNKNPKITIGIVLYKGEKYLEKCISSVLNQSYTNFELLLRDQGSEHEALAFLEEKFPEILSDARVKIFRGKNLWHSGGHNKLIAEMSEDSDAYLCASNDMLYEQNFLEILVKNMQENSDFSVFVPKLRYWDFSEKNSENSGKTNILDSCGISLSKNHCFFDRGQGEEDTNQYKTGEIFGGSGALFLIQKSALESVQFSPEKNPEISEFFDEEIHYKNDIDLAYRLQWSGNKTLFVEDSLAYHDRQVGEQNTTPKSLWVKESSFYGQLVVLEKNFWGRGFSFFLKIRVCMRILLISIFYLFTSPRVLLQYKKFIKNKNSEKKGGIQEKKKSMKIKNSAQELKNFFI